MTVKIAKKDIASMHASVDELAATLPEAFQHLSGLIANLMSSTAAVSVPVKGKKASSKKTDDFEDEDELSDDGDDDDDDDDDDADLEDEGDDEDDDAPLEDEDDEGDDDDDGEEGDELELPVLENLDTDSVFEAFENADPNGNVHDKADAGIRELEAAIAEFGFDKADLYKEAGARNPTAKKEAAQDLLTRLYLTMDAIAEYQYDDVVSFATDADDSFKPAKRGTPESKMEAAAKALLIAALVASADAEEEDED